jgi:hypothetical protein
MSASLGQCLGKAKDFAREQSHRAITLEHLLLALTEDTDAAGVLRACNVDIDRLGTDVSGYLGRLLEDMRAPPGTEPGPDAELLRVVEAARQAAAQSRRRTIDGAIVLAAIVGDAKSPAAGLLKAHGMTFEEAIKTLQKASAQARTRQFSSSGPAARTSAERPAAEPAEKPAAPSAPTPPAPAPAKAPAPSGDADASPTGQTADDFLAAARARIQQRSASTPAASTEPAVQSAAKSPPVPSQGDPEELPLMSLSAFTANRAAAGTDAPPLNGTAGPPIPPTASTPPAPAPGPPPPPAFGTPPGPAEGRPPPPPGPPGAFPPAGERLPPVPPGSGAPPLPRLPERAARAERPDGSAPPLRRPPAPNGALPGQRRAGAEASSRQARVGAPPVRSGQRAAAGPLMEAIPRKMRVGSAAPAQVRIGRDKIDNLMQLLMGSRALHHPETVVARVLSVRLRAPDGGFAIEAGAPETQWIEAAPGQPQDEHVLWNWTVTPLRRGRRRLQLLVSARTVGRDGIVSEQAPPDRTIDVTVRPNLLRRLVRWAVVVVLLGTGAALGRLSQDKLAQDLLDVGGLIVKNILGLLHTSGFLAG